MSKIPVSGLHILRLLIGKWRITRDITNNINQSFSGSASGTAEFLALNTNTLSYNEHVRIFYNNGFRTGGAASYKFKIKKSKLHQYTSGTSKESHMFKLIFFIENNSTYAEATYSCERDKYIVNYSFNNTNKLSIIYLVSGPKKDYRIQTNFERIKMKVSLSP